MEILNCEQGSPEWFDARIGSIGGSSISSVVAKAREKGSGMRVNLLYQLAGELLSGQKYESYSNDHMARGIELEGQARNDYEVMTNNEVAQVGLIKDSQYKHTSPDGLVCHDGMVEIKCVIPSVHIKTIISEKIDGNYLTQMQWGLGISDRKWCDFISYSPLVADRAIWVKRIKRDERRIKELEEAANQFIKEMLEVIEKIKGGSYDPGP